MENWREMEVGKKKRAEGVGFPPCSSRSGEKKKSGKRHSLHTHSDSDLVSRGFIHIG